VVERRDTTEIVSCKSRGINRGPWTLVDLCANGGLAHLFSRWTSFRDVKARLMTCGGLKTGEFEAEALCKACMGIADQGNAKVEFDAMRDAFARALLAAGRKKNTKGIPKTEKPPRRQIYSAPIPDGFAETVEEFMRVLKIKAGLPMPAHIRSQHVEQVSRPFLRKAGRNHAVAGECYDKVVGIVYDKNLIDELTGDYANWLVDLDGKHGSARGNLAALVEARSIYPHDVTTAIAQSDNTRLLRRSSGASAPDRLRIKLVAGGVRETRINSAIRLREGWLSAWNSLRTDLPGDRAEREDLEARVLDIAGDVEAVVATTGSEWGDKMYDGLRDRFRAFPVQTASGLALSAEHLLGVALDLASECQVWFSEPFDVDSAVKSAWSSEGVVNG
jgi:hypothetical protein